MTKRKQRPEPDDYVLNLRLNTRFVERVDALLGFVSGEVLRTDETGQSATRADVWREALLRGLKSMEKARDGGKS